MFKTKSKIIRIIAFSIIITAFSYCSVTAVLVKLQDYNYVPKEGYVPDAETAVKIAEAIWLPIYGKSIYSSKPFMARLSEDRKTWVVTGTLFKPQPDTISGNTVIRTVGGVPYIEIRKQDCSILRLYHSE